MATLNATYTSPSRAIYTDLDPHGSGLLGSTQGIAVRAAIATSVFDHASVSQNLMSITLKDGSSFFASGNFNKTFETSSAADFLSQISGTMTQITEIEAIDLHNPRYTLSDISLSVQGLFSNATWADVLKGYDTLIGGGGGDNLVDYGNHVTFEGRGGNDYLVAGSHGQNVAIYRGNTAEYQIASTHQISFADHQNLDGYTITDSNLSRDGKDSLVNIERLQFADGNIALDSAKGENAGMAYRIYKAAFDRVPDAEGLGFWINALDQGYSLEQVATTVMTSPEFQRVYGANSSNNTFVNLLYQHVLHRDADSEGLNFWNDALNAGYSRGAVLAVYTECPETIGLTAELIASGIRYAPFVG